MSPDDLRAWIKSRRLTQAEAAERLGLSRDHLCHVLAGRYPVGRQTQLLVAALDGAAKEE